MDIIIRISPRRIERAILIVIIIALIISNIYFYRNQGTVDTTPTDEPQGETTTETTTQTTTDTTDVTGGTTAEAADDTTDTTETTTGDCTEGWACKPNVPYKGYQNSDCSWDVETYVLCDNGCEDGECVTAD